MDRQLSAPGDLRISCSRQAWCNCRLETSGKAKLALLGRLCCRIFSELFFEVPDFPIGRGKCLMCPETLACFDTVPVLRNVKKMSFGGEESVLGTI